MRDGIPIVISAPSGAGKTTLVNLILKDIKGLAFSVSSTTRPPSPKEKEGRDYFFISEKEFLKKKKAGKFIETALVHGHHYGTLKKQLDEKLKKGKDVILDIDVQGAMNIRKIYPQALLIFIVPPSTKVLSERLRERHRDSEKEIKKRLHNARKEMKYRKFYDYTVVNDSLKKAFSKLESIIKKERKLCHH
ncbi:MAG: guanylate kinase [Elusimicrobia bacterium]|nr:guanylate kinase [Elusimicrobiota bacterium]